MVVLFEPQDLVNIALVIRAMKNMGLSRLRVVAPAEYDAYRIEGIAHDTGDVIERVEICQTIEEALTGVVRVVAATARRRTQQQEWATPEQAAKSWLEIAASEDVAVVFGREDRGLPNHVLDLSHEAVCIPTNVEHTSMNLGHAAVILFYEIRKAAMRMDDLPERDLSGKLRDKSPPATADEMESFFGLWEKAMDTIGMFRNVPPISRMRMYRKLFNRAYPDRREHLLLEATAYRVIHYAARLKERLQREGVLEEQPDSTPTQETECEPHDD
ncbi:MAG: TrmH family RNA methyltransferase [Gemmatimonadota bacterium]